MFVLGVDFIEKNEGNKSLIISKKKVGVSSDNRLTYFLQQVYLGPDPSPEPSSTLGYSVIYNVPHSKLCMAKGSYDINVEHLTFTK